MHLLGCLFSSIFIIFIFIFASLRQTFRVLFGSKGQHDRHREPNFQNTNQQKKESNSHHTKRKGEKIFSDDEGEYVDYEEIK